MFSKALFKQSCKANGTMWAVIAFAVCFMLACVMLISGRGSIGDTRNAIQDTIITKEIDSAVEKRAINYYVNETEGLARFDAFFVANFAAAVQAGADAGTAANTAYAASVGQLQDYLEDKALSIDPAYTADSAEALELIASVMYVLNPDGMFDAFYTSHGEAVPEAYDAASLAFHVGAGDIADYLASEERAAYISSRAESGAAVFLAGNLTEEANIDKIVGELAAFGVTKEKYDGFGYTYTSLRHAARTTVITYRNRLEYETAQIDERFAAGEIDAEEYAEQLSEANAALIGDITDSLLASLPAEVSAALEEIGRLDLFSLIVGSIFYKLAGLLLPIIYMIMASNNLISGQVDSGSMAYVLSTSTKRKTVVFTQAVYLIGSLFAMFCLTTVTGCVCLAIVGQDVTLTYGDLALLNLGAFLVLFALSGLCFLTSCWFDRSKRSMAVGGGLSIFALVAAMLGLFGSPIIPSVVRMDALNAFNYVTVISLFDVVSIIDAGTAFIWKFVVLLALGAAGYAIGWARFVKKDLPL